MWPELWNKREKLDNHETHTTLKVKSKCYSRNSNAPNATVVWIELPK